MRLNVMWKFWHGHHNQTVNFSKFQRQFQIAAFRVLLNKTHHYFYNDHSKLVRTLHFWFFPWFSGNFHSSCVSLHIMFHFYFLKIKFQFESCHTFSPTENYTIFCGSQTKKNRNYLATILIGKYRESFFTSSQMNPVLLMFPSSNQPSRLTDQTELQRVDTTRVSN